MQTPMGFMTCMPGRPRAVTWPESGGGVWLSLPDHGFVGAQTLATTGNARLWRRAQHGTWEAPPLAQR